MTTNKLIVVSDLATDNELLVLPRTSCQLEAIGHIVSEWHARKARETTFYLIIDYLFNLYPNGEFWIFTCSSLLKNANNLQKHKHEGESLWGYLKDYGFETRVDKKIEWKVESDDKNTFFGACQVDKLAYENIDALSVENRQTRLIFFTHSVDYFTFNSSLPDGWDTSYFILPPYKLINFICKFEAVLIQFVGEFDDLESGVLAISNSGIIIQK